MVGGLSKQIPCFLLAESWPERRGIFLLSPLGSAVHAGVRPPPDGLPTLFN